MSSDDNGMQNSKVACLSNK